MRHMRLLFNSRSGIMFDSTGRPRGLDITLSGTELNRYLIDSNCRVILPMPLCPAVLFLTLLFEDDDFFLPILFNYRPLNGHIRNHGRAELDTSVVFDQ